MESNPSKSTPIPQKRWSILLADDVPSRREATSALLQSWGYQVHEAETPRRAIQLMRLRVDMLLFQIVIPSVAYGPIFEDIVCDRELSCIPIVISSTYTDQSAEVKELQTRFAGRLALSWIPQPYTVATLKAAIDRIFLIRKKERMDAAMALGQSQASGPTKNTDAHPRKNAPWMLILAAGLLLGGLYYGVTQHQYQKDLKAHQKVMAEKVHQLESAADYLFEQPAPPPR